MCVFSSQVQIKPKLERMMSAESLEVGQSGGQIVGQVTNATSGSELVGGQTLTNLLTSQVTMPW